MALSASKFLVAAADFRFRLFALGDVEEKPLIRDGGAGSVRVHKGG